MLICLSKKKRNCSSSREPNSIMFSVIKIMIKMHSTKLKMMGELIFCLENVIFITKFVIFYLKTG